MIDKQIAIIGGGAAGLTAAFFLHNRTSVDGKYVFKCTVFDKRERLGGNAFSAYLGEDVYQPPFVDLGVNDFNSDRYKYFMAVLAELANAGYPVSYAPLIDTTTWYTPASYDNSSISYTADEMANWENHPDKPYLQNIAKDWDAFNQVASEVLTDPKYRNMSVDEFIEDQGYSYEFAEYNLRARINGMYYVSDQLPGDMPILGVMKYYHLQEGIGGDKTTAALRAGDASATPRQYFVNGASSWIEQLTKYLTAQGVQFVKGASPTAILQSDLSWHVLSATAGPGVPTSYAAVISAVYANEVSRVIPTGLPQLMPFLLAQFRYFDSISIVHDDASLLPAQQEQWSTYNILIYPPNTRMLRPYTITYVTQKHQGHDTNDPPYLTLTPFGPIPESTIQQMIDLGELPAKDKISAVTYLKHNLVSVDSMAAQRYLPSMQGINNLYFTGGWTNGAGLHEEIIAQSLDVASRLRGIIPIHGPENYVHDDPSHVPGHVRKSLGEDLPLLPDGIFD